ncbi:tail fiber domain-containing protein [Solirubrum puertoriconensis]|uniref:Peptidase S74 domain-containing protein n=1 Tax=Solirubrum puertoriconensis TaxID=1751427 RepID=A0A9X0L592_SOLP1|nr:tail fiber domain-containing protein [Solirubrum puertoriconensis]KUG08310.1 hypothetical protein ASU33_09045 [Solirubrum puertoriconensis]
MASSALAALWLKSTSKNGRANGQEKRSSKSAESSFESPIFDIGNATVIGSGQELAPGSVGVGITARGGLNLGQNNGRNLYLGYRSGPETAPTAADGTFNTNVGVLSGRKNTSGSDNTFVGCESGTANTTGISNTFLGRNSGKANNTGSANTFTGSASGQSTTSGNNNTFAGASSGIRNTSSNDNTYLGAASGFNSTGACNTFVGSGCGIGNTTGSNNWALGFQAGPTEGNLQNCGAIGYRAQVGQSNSLALGGTGNFAVRVGIGTPMPQATLHVIGNIQASGAIEQVSDARYKTQIRPLENALSKVLALRGVSFNWRAGEFPEQRFSDRPQLGFVSQEVETQYPELVSEDTHGRQRLDYGRLTAVLVEAIKEQQLQLETLRNELAAMRAGKD